MFHFQIGCKAHRPLDIMISIMSLVPGYWQLCKMYAGVQFAGFLKFGVKWLKSKQPLWRRVKIPCNLCIKGGFRINIKTKVRVYSYLSHWYISNMHSTFTFLPKLPVSAALSVGKGSALFIQEFHCIRI